MSLSLKRDNKHSANVILKSVNSFISTFFICTGGVNFKKRSGFFRELRNRLVNLHI